MRGRKTAMTIAAGMALTTGGVAVVTHASASGFRRTASGHTATPGLARFYDQPISWHGCQTGPDDELGKGLDAAGAQCGQVSVPLNYSRPDRGTITVAMSRIKATDSAHP